MQRLKVLQSHQGFMRYFKNTSWLFGEKVLRIVVGLFVGIWVARYLGPEQFGLFSYTQSFVGLFTVIATLGLDAIVVRELVKDESRRDELIGTVFWLKIFGALGVLVMLAIAINFTSNDTYTNTLIFIIASATIFQSFNVVDMYFQSKVSSKYVVYANVISLFSSSIVKIVLILNEAPLIAFAWTILFDTFILASGLVYFYLKNRCHSEQSDCHSVLDTESSFAWKFNKSTALSLLKESWPLILSGIALMIQARIDQVMLQEMIGSKEVGYYSVALRLIETFGLVPMLLNGSIFPALVNAKKVSQELYKERFLNYYRLSFLLFLLVAIPIFLFSEKIIVLLYGIAYQPAGILLPLMAIRLFFTNIGVARSSFINIEHLFKFSLVTMIFGAIVNVALNYYLIPLYQSQGAIVATIFSFFVTVFLIDFLYIKTRENVKSQVWGMLTFYKINLKGV
jgi:O-antigen/teichoic acid export membrane protein